MAYDKQREAEEASSLLALARQIHEQHVAAAKVKAAKIIADAEAEADKLLKDAREEDAWLQKKISEHKEFEARYRSTLKVYLGGLLQELSEDEEFVSAPSTIVVEEVPAEEPLVEEITDLEVAEPEVVAPVPVFSVFPEPEAVVEEVTEEEELPEPEAPAFSFYGEETPAEPVEETFQGFSGWGETPGGRSSGGGRITFHL